MNAHRILCLIALVSLLPCALAADPAPDMQPPGPDFVRQDSRVVTDENGLTFEVVTLTDARGHRKVTVEQIAVGTAALPIEGAAPPATESITAPSGPATNGWVNIGPDGGTVLDVNASPLDPQLLLAGLDAPLGYSPTSHPAIYRSTDGGATWSPSLMLNQAGYSIRINDIEFSPEGVAYAGGDLGLFRSGDGGVTWTRLMNTSYADRLLDVAIEPGDSRRIWIGLGSYYNSSPRIMRSTDGGTSWQTITVPLVTPLDCRSIAFDPARPGVVYVAFGQNTIGQIWMSLDNGASWINRSGYLPGTPLNKVAVVGTSVMVAAGEWSYGSQYGGLYVSEGDNGFWRAINRWPANPYLEVVEDFAVDPTNSCKVWAATPRGLFSTTNCGETWKLDNLPQRITPHSVRAFAGPAPMVLAGTENYAVMKREGSGSFEFSSRGIRELNVVSVSANPLDPNELAAAFNNWNSGGIYTSLDGGQTWKVEPALRSRLATVDFAPDGSLYAISDGPSDVATEGVYRRAANGEWAAYGPHRGPYFETQLNALCFDPQQPGLVVTAGVDWTNGRPVIFRSTDGGVSWSQVYLGQDSGSIYDLAIVGAGSTRATLATLRSWLGYGAMLRSTDHGNSWTSGALGTTFPYALAVSPRDPNLVYFTNNYYSLGLYRSRDAGLTWQGTNYYGTLLRVALHPDDDREIFGAASYPYYELVRSRDGGTSFFGYSDGMSPIPAAQDFFVQAGDCPRLYAATSTGVHVRPIARPHLTVSLDHEVLWPPNHELIPIHASVQVSEACDIQPQWRLLSIKRDEGGGGVDADIVGAATGTADDAFELRAARDGYGDGRTYTIVYEASDASGNSVTDTVTVVAPHDQSGLPNGVIPLGSRAAGDVAFAPPRLIPSAGGTGTALRFGLVHPDRVRIDVYDLLGARVRTLADEMRSAGRHEVAWDGRDAGGRTLPSGVYLVQLQSRELRWSGKAVVVR